MLLVLQFPLADSRPFLTADGVGRLKTPGWPIPNPHSDFVRAFGPIRRRWRGGLSGWLGENFICEANRALAFEKGDFSYPANIDQGRKWESDSIQFWVAFRRFYTDGGGVAKFEIGLVIDTKWLWSPVSAMDTQGLLTKILSLPVSIPNPAAPGRSSCPLFQAGPKLAGLYLWSSSLLREFSFKKAPEWWVTAGEPILYLTQDGGGERLQFRGGSRPISLSQNIAGSLSHHLIEHAGHDFRLWNFVETGWEGDPHDHRPDFYTWDSQVEARKMRLYLLRLHAEKQCLSHIVNNVDPDRINPARGTPASERLQQYFNESIRRITTLRKHSTRLADLEIEAFAREVEERMTAGEYDSILTALERLDMRPQILDKAKKELAGSINRTALRKQLTERLSLGEINTLSFDLNIDYENFPPTKVDRVMALIRHVENRRQLQAIIDWLKANRADVLES